MKKIFLLIMVLITGLLSAINLEQAQEMGLKKNFDYQNSDNDLKSATASKYQAYSAILPSVTASGNYNGDDFDFENTNYSLDLRQPIFQGGTILYGMKIANTQEDTAENNLTSAKVNLLADVESKYFSVLEAAALLDVSETSLERATIQLQTADIKHKLGAISSSDFMQFQLEKSQSDVSYFSADKQYKTSLKDFNNYLNSEDQIPEEISVNSSIDEAEELSKYSIPEIEAINEKLSDTVMGQNLTLKNSENSVETAKSYLRLAQTSFLPTVDLTASQSWIDNATTDDFEDSQSIGLSISVPIFPLVDQGLNYSSKKYDYLTSQNNLEDSKNSTQLQSETAWLELITSAKNLVSAQISLSYATSIYNQSTTEFKLGELSSTDYLNSSISLSNTESQYYSSIYDYLRDKSNLNKLLCEVDYSNLNSIIFKGAK
ncbi:MAG: TolC family protein [Candidatus Tenebribacter davisii]|nr:TolC family protein [Candidatus Tenebribacter davisii]